MLSSPRRQLLAWDRVVRPSKASGEPRLYFFVQHKPLQKLPKAVGGEGVELPDACSFFEVLCGRTSVNQAVAYGTLGGSEFLGT